MTRAWAFTAVHVSSVTCVKRVWLQRPFQHGEPDRAWVTDKTYIRMHEGWLYLAAVLNALTMAVWRRRPKDSVTIHSNQGSQFGSDGFNRWCKDNRSSTSMGRRENCWADLGFCHNAVAKSEIFNGIESFCSQVRRDMHIDQLRSYEFERQRQTAP